MSIYQTSIIIMQTSPFIHLRTKKIVEIPFAFHILAKHGKGFSYPMKTLRICLFNQSKFRKYQLRQTKDTYNSQSL